MKTKDTSGAGHAAWVWTMLLIGIVLLALGGVLVNAKARMNARTAAERTLTFVTSQIDRYEVSRTNDRTKSLIRLLDKTTELAERIACDGELTASVLDGYAYNQRLTGIVVLDETLGLEEQTACDGDSFAFVSSLVEPGRIEDIVRYPLKSYMTRLEHGGATYDYVATGRRDAAGVIIAYALKDDANAGEITLDTLFTGYDIRMDGVIVVTDGENVIGTNNAALMNAPVSAFEDEFSAHGTKSGLTRWTGGGKIFLGEQIYRHGYQISVLFPVRSLCRSGVVVLIAGAAVFALFCVLALLLRQRAHHAGLLQMEKQFDTLNAIGELYTSCLLLFPQTGRAELVKAPEHTMMQLNPEKGAQVLLRQLCDQHVAEPYREQFMAFTDPATAAERLKGHRFLSFLYNSVRGRWILVLLVPQHYDENGVLTGVLLIFRDVSEEQAREADYQKRLEHALEDAERANHAKTDFLRRMSHDIRTPINAIRGMVAISRYDPENEEKQEECREKIMLASGYLLELVGDVLDMSKLESGTVQLEHRPFDLDAVLSAVLDQCQAQAALSSVTIRREPLRCEHRWLIGSPVHLQRVLQNIALNAVKYNRENGTVAFSCRETDSDGETARFEFICADTGIGMSKEFQERAFEPFAQEQSASARTNYGGTGLGLAIARELTERMGGTLRFESEPGKGTTFYITMPFAIDSAPPAAQDAPGDEGGGLGGMRILLAEDNALNMEIASYMLRHEGAAVTECWNGREAAECFAKSEPGSVDVILMDVMMPDMDGLEAARAIRAMERPDAKTVPIIAMSANAFEDDVARSLSAGMNAHLAKPVDAAKLLAAIRQCSRDRRCPDETRDSSAGTDAGRGGSHER